MILNIGKHASVLTNSLILSILANSFIILPGPSQSSDPSDFPDTFDTASNDPSVEPAIKETREEVSLEKEYAERNVDWHAWAEKVAGAVWDPLIADGALIVGRTVVRWQVTRDNHVRIISVQTPIPGGANTLIASIKALDGNPILTFPRGSGRTVVNRVAGVRGPAIMHRAHGPIKVYP